MLFSSNGFLVPGIHFMTWEGFYDQFNFSPKRKILLEGLERAITILRQCGCTVIYIDGSFVTQKLEPNDYDACWEGDFDFVCANMLIIEPVFLDFLNGRKNQKIKYEGEFLPAECSADSIGTKYLEFFQQIKFSTNKKGIVAIKL
jgi:hypothetical protein